MRVLIVDDNEINVRVMKGLVGKSLKADAICYTVSSDALDFCSEQEVDLVLVDFMMPDIDGLEFIERFRAMDGKADVPIVMITAAEDREVRYKALELGANDFLNKPIDNAEFVVRARNMLAIRLSKLELSNRADWLAEEVRKATMEIIAREREVIFRLTKATEYRSPETGAHILRMALYSKTIARKMGLTDDEQDLLLTAAPMHDIGKVGTPDNVLLKEGKLTQDEYEIMKEHTLMGYEILNGSKSKLLQIAAEIALAHHEKFDGSGYPKGLKGEDIPLMARICAISDVFDALTSPRTYKKAWTTNDALAEIDRQSGRYFDPVVISAFKSCLSEILAIKEKFSDGSDAKQ